MTTPILFTERLILRPLKISDAREIYHNWTSDADVAKFMRWNVHKSIDDTIDWLKAEEDAIDSDNIYNWGFVLKETNELIGSGGLIYNKDKSMFELGYNLMKKYWGNGFATEASRIILEFGKEVLNQNNFYCCHAKENIASEKVINKLGFIYTKDCEYYSWDRVKRFDCKEYCLKINK